MPPLCHAIRGRVVKGRAVGVKIPLKFGLTGILPRPNRDFPLHSGDPKRIPVPQQTAAEVAPHSGERHGGTELPGTSFPGRGARNGQPFAGSTSTLQPVS